MKSKDEKNNSYQKKYYEENKKKILKRRKLKYETNEEYRESIKNRARKYERVVKKPERKIIETRVAVAKEIDGKTMLFYPVGYLSDRIGRSIKTIYSWEKKDVLPETPYRDENNRRLYTKEMVEAVYKAIEEQGFPGNLDITEFKNSIIARWQALNVI